MPAPSLTRLRWSGRLLGFGLGGFFDGILLHQILQWHHLLSLVPGPAFADLRVQILADGLFHAAMYAVAAAGLWLLWRARAVLGTVPEAGRVVAAEALLGFGAWHIVDGVLVHWVLVLHRIRPDSPSPLAWDLGFFIGFGLLPALIGWWLARTRGGGAGPRPRAAMAPLALVAATLAAGPVAALPPPVAEEGKVLVVFRPGITTEAVLAAAAALDARLVAADAGGGVWIFDLPDAGRAWRLHAHGALLVGGSGSLLGVGCLAWSRPG